MDNLAHSAFAAILGTALAPELAVKLRGRFFIASALLANLPDIDIAFALVGKEIYVFQHRGLTHSLFGLLITLPLGCLILNRLIGYKIKAKGLKDYGRSFCFFFVLMQLMISHFFLDYLTSYGTMFLYPFSWERFSYPLMFIVDPFFWLVTLGGFYSIWILNKTPTKPQIPLARKRAIIALLSCCALWTIELSGKKKIEEIALDKKSAKYREKKAEYLIDSYPAPLAPLNWHMVAYSKDRQEYWQSSFSFFREGSLETKSSLHSIPSIFKMNQLCDDQVYEEAAKYEFLKFQRWAEHALCSPFTFEDTQGCRCFSLKYSLADTNLVSYGSFFIDPKGEGFFLPMEDRQHIMKFYQRAFFGQAN